MNITGAGQLQGDGFLLRPIVEDDAEVIASASLSDVPDWTFIPRDLGEDQSRAWIRRGLPARESGMAVRFVIQVDGRLAGTVGAEHLYAHDKRTKSRPSTATDPATPRCTRSPSPGASRRMWAGSWLEAFLSSSFWKICAAGAPIFPPTWAPR
jgi:hypothetical protein